MKTICFIVLLIGSIQTSAQKFTDLDKSPMDISYFPHNFSHDRKFAASLIGSDPAMIRVIYSRPAKKDREIFGKLLAFGKVWRAGANEETEIKFYRDLTFGGKMIKTGTYSLFVIPEANEWTIILNNDPDQWGAYSYQEKNDVVRFKVPVTKASSTIENFSIVFEKVDGKNAKMFMGWDESVVEVPIVY
ncbi:MAG: DUF2911 domain-containing protein [Saprospiraceae bacterium]